MRNIYIAVHDRMLAAALALPRVLYPLNPQETLEARQHWYQAGNAPYPAWYFFGNRVKGVEGLVEMYSRQNLRVVLSPISQVSENIETDLLDAQFCSLPHSLYRSLCNKGIKIVGYMAESMSSKATQAIHLTNNTGNRFLPVQFVFNRDTKPTLPQGKRKVWILKAANGCAGRSASGEPYTVWLDEILRDSMAEIIASLPEGEELVCSEFVTTSDPYAGGADHVVHKIHFLADTGQPAYPYGAACQRFIHRCDWQALQHKQVLPLGDFIGTPEIKTGSVDSLSEFPSFAGVLNFLRGRVIVSVDFMVPPDGIPRFLEINKLAATFAERFDPQLPAVIDRYSSLPL